MDRDVYLILIGAGISLASSLVTLLIQFLLGQASDNIRRRKDSQTQRSQSIRSALIAGVSDPEPQIASASRMQSILKAGERGDKGILLSRLPNEAAASREREHRVIVNISGEPVPYPTLKSSSKSDSNVNNAGGYIEGGTVHQTVIAHSDDKDVLSHLPRKKPVQPPQPGPISKPKPTLNWVTPYVVGSAVFILWLIQLLLKSK